MVAALLLLGTLTAPVATAAILVKAEDDTYDAIHDRALSVSAADGLLANDAGLGLTAVRLTNPAHGTVTVNADGSFTYRPDGGYIGSDSFTYEARILNLGVVLVKDAAVVTLHVTNDAPTAANDTYAATTGKELVVPASGVLANDSDADGDALTAILVDGGGNGSLDLSSNGGFTYKSGGSFTGVRTFTYRASDGIDQSSVRTVTITVSAPSSTQAPTPRPTPAPTVAPTPTPTPAPTLSLPILPPLPTLPPIIPTPRPTAAPTPTPMPTGTPRPVPTGSAAATPAPSGSTRPTTSPGASTPPSTAAPSSGAVEPSASPTSPADPPPGAGPIAGGGGSGGGSGAGSGGGPGAPAARPEERFTVPVVRDASGAPGAITIDTGFVAFGGFEWAVPAFVLTVPGLLLILAVFGQTLIGLAWVPVTRRWLREEPKPAR